MNMYSPLRPALSSLDTSVQALLQPLSRREQGDWHLPPATSPEEARTTPLFGRYLFCKLLSKGGMCSVYEAWDVPMQKKVAIKVLRREERMPEAKWQRTAARFSQEAHDTALAYHKNIVGFEGYFEQRGVRYLVLECIEGITLRKWMKQRRATPRQCLYIMFQLCCAVRELHAQGLVHRDLKPENVMITSDNRVVLLDLGIAYHMKQARSEEFVWGTPGYLAPEQLSLDAVSEATDVYALGAILFELMAGRHLFAGEGVEELIIAHLNHKLPDFAAHCPEPSEPIWCRVVETLKVALQPASSERYATVGAFWLALSGHRLAPVRYRTARFV